MAVPTKFYTFVDSQADAGKLTAARLNGDFDPLYACLDPALGGLEDTNVKAGAKIVCTDRVHTVSAAWTFSVCPTFPDASIPGAKLATDVNADTVDSLHAADFAVAAKGVTNGDTHSHTGGDGAAIAEGALAFSDVTAADVSTSVHGLCPKAPNDATKFLRGDATWAVPLHYALAITSLNHAAPADLTTYYVGNQAAVPDTTVGLRRVYIPKAGTIKVAYITYTALTTGTSESFSIYIRLNNTTDYLIKAVADNPVCRVFDNAALSIAVVAGDYIEIKVVGADWATTPANVLISGSIYIE